MKKKKQGSQVFWTECEIQGAHHMMYNFMPNQDFQVACEQIKALEATRCC